MRKIFAFIVGLLSTAQAFAVVGSPTYRPHGVTGEVQLSSGGVFGSESSFRYDASSATLSVTKINVTTVTASYASLSTFTNVPSLPNGLEINGSFYNSFGGDVLVTVSTVSLSSATINILNSNVIYVSSTIIARGPTVNVKSFGALGDGSNDTSAINAALTYAANHGCAPVYFPTSISSYTVSSYLEIPCDGMAVYGDGPTSRINQTGTESNSTVFYVNAKKNVSFRDMKIIPSTVTTSTFFGWGIRFVGSTACVVDNVHITRHLRGGIMLQDSNYGTISRNQIYDALVSPANTDFTGSGTDILVSGSHNSIYENRITSGAGAGINICTLGNVATSYANTVTKNRIQYEGSYGILLYQNQIGQNILHTIVSKNDISDITGDFKDAGVFVYGTGVYIQAAEDSIITENSVFRTHTTTNPITNQLAPAGIGVTNASTFLISGNHIESDLNFPCILVVDPNNEGIPFGWGILENNNLINCQNGYKIGERGNVSINGGGISSMIGTSILIANTSDYHPAFPNQRIDISNVNISSGLSSGVSISSAANVTLSNLKIFGNASYGISIGTAANVMIQNCVVSNGSKTAGSAGAQILIAASSVTFSNNSFFGNQYGFISPTAAVSTACVRLVNNKIYGNTLNFSGPLGEVRTLTTNFSAPFVSDGRIYLTTNTIATTVTTFNGGYDGQQLFIIINDTNTAFNFTSGNIRGSSISPLSFAQNDSILCTYTADTDLWYCMTNDFGNVVSSNAAQALISSTTANNIASILLTPGDWDVSATIRYNGAASNGDISFGISTATNSFAGTVNGQTKTFTTISNNGHAGGAISPIQVSLSLSTTYYLVAQFSAGLSTETVAGSGTIYGRRKR